MEHLTCIICYELFENPVTLSCGHSFCKVCINHHLMNNSKCPLCGCFCTSSNLQTNITLKSLVESMGKEEVEEKKVKKVKKVVESSIQKILCFPLANIKYTFLRTYYKLDLLYFGSLSLFKELIKD